MRRVLVVLACALALVACGVPEDDHPQELSAEEVPFGLLTTPSTTTTTPNQVPAARTADLYFLESPNRLARVPREVDDQRPRTVLTTLVDTTSADLETGFTTAIPPDTRLLDATVDDRVLTVDLSDEFRSIQGEGAIAAVAQIVFSATDLPGINAVEFQVEGEDIEVSDQDGAQQDGPVDKFDYSSLAPLEP